MFADMNRGVGGPLLCIGDLLSDVADDGAAGDTDGSLGISLPSSSSAGLRFSQLQPLRTSRDLCQVFEENYDELIQSLEGTDHSWTALTLKLCTALKTADKLVTSANSNTDLLLEKMTLLESIIKRGDSAITVLQTIQNVKVNMGHSSNAPDLDAISRENDPRKG